MSLREKVISGMYWTAGARFAGQGVTWVITIVVIRLLTPEDYGLLAMATVFTSVCALLAEAGLGAALVQAKEITDNDKRYVFGAAIVVHSLLFLSLVFTAPLIAQFFAEERLISVVRVQSLQLLVAVFAIVPMASHTRELNFKYQSLIGVVSAICGSLTTLLLALLGYGVWALVVGNLGTMAFITIGMNWASPFVAWPRFSFRHSKRLLAFGGQLTAARVLSLLYAKADVLVAGRLLGKEALGLYSIAMHIAMLPIGKLSSILNQIAFPAFARAQNDPSAVKRYLLKALRIQCLLAFPSLWGLSSVAPEIVDLLLGAQWQRAVWPLQVLALVMPLNAISYTLNAAFQGLGHSGRVFANVLTASIVMPMSFWFGAHWGINGVALAWLIGFPIVLTLNIWRMLPLVHLAFSEIVGAIGPAAGAAGAMYIVVVSTRHLLTGLSPLVLLMILIVLGMAIYSLVMWKISKTMLREFINLFRSRQGDVVEVPRPQARV